MDLVVQTAKHIKQILGMLCITTSILTGSWMYLISKDVPVEPEAETDWTHAQTLADARLEEQKQTAERDRKIEEAKEEARIIAEAEAEEKARKQKEAEEQARKQKEAEEQARKQAEEEEARRQQEEAAQQTQQPQQPQQPQQNYTGTRLTKGAGTIIGPSGKETYYNLPMEGVVSIMRGMGNTDEYWVREDGVKMLGDYVIIAADLNTRPRGSYVETSLGMGIVCDTGGFAAANPTQIDIATAW